MKVEKLIFQDKTSTTLPIMEAFYTIQGEGFYQGKAAYFIRLQGCDVGCIWCDVKESWELGKYPYSEVSGIVSGALQYPARLAVITGGEPLMYQLDHLTSELKSKGFQTNIETSGAYPLSGTWDWICFSPKKFKEPLPGICEVAHELKVIIYNRSDFAFAEQYKNKVKPECKLFLQPEWSKCNEMLPLIIEYVKQHPKWEVSLQIHKYMNIP